MPRSAINGKDKPRILTTVTVSNPAAGADWSYTVPTGGGRTLESVSYVFLNDAQAGNRLGRVRVRRGGVAIYQAAASAVTVANGTGTYSFAKGLVANTVTSTSPLNPLFKAPPLLAGDVIDSNCLNIQTGDQFSAILLQFSGVQ